MAENNTIYLIITSRNAGDGKRHLSILKSECLDEALKFEQIYYDQLNDSMNIVAHPFTFYELVRQIGNKVYYFKLSQSGTSNQ